MSRTDNTTPPRLWDAHGLVYHRVNKWLGYGHRADCAYVTYRRKALRSARQQERLALRRGVEPEPYRPRHGARWKAW